MTMRTAASLQRHRELSERELDAVAGGQKATTKPASTPKEYLKITMQDVLITS